MSAFFSGQNLRDSGKYFACFLVIGLFMLRLLPLIVFAHEFVSCNGKITTKYPPVTATLLDFWRTENL